MIQRASESIFNALKCNEKTKREYYRVKASFLELYNEGIFDLLHVNQDEQKKKVTIRENEAGQIIWSGIKEVEVGTVDEVIKYRFYIILACSKKGC